MFVSNGKLNASYDEFAAMCHKSSLIYLSSNYCVLKVNANKRNIAMNGCNRQYGDCTYDVTRLGFVVRGAKHDCRCFDTVDAGGCSVLAAAQPALRQIESFGTCNGQTMAAASAFNQFINYSERF